LTDLADALAIALGRRSTLSWGDVAITGPNDDPSVLPDRALGT